MQVVRDYQRIRSTKREFKKNESKIKQFREESDTQGEDLINAQIRDTMEDTVGKINRSRFHLSFVRRRGSFH